MNAAGETPPEKTALKRQITATDTQIDRLVYDRYGLSDEGIKLVEGGQSSAPGARRSRRFIVRTTNRIHFSGAQEPRTLKRHKCRAPDLSLLTSSPTNQK